MKNLLCCVLFSMCFVFGSGGQAFAQQRTVDPAVAAGVFLAVVGVTALVFVVIGVAADTNYDSSKQFDLLAERERPTANFSPYAYSDEDESRAGVRLNIPIAW